MFPSNILITVIFFFGLFPIRPQLLGKNECAIRNGYRVCCSGWRKSLNSRCEIPICGGFCGLDGECIRPDVCKCADQRERYDCSDDKTSDNLQYDQPEFAIPEYRRGERKASTKTDLCFLSIERGLCAKPLFRGKFDQSPRGMALNITQELCCNSVGFAWSNKCELCSDLHEDEYLCPKGYTWINNECVDIDECEYAVCQGGRCVNQRGSFSCDCPSGYSYNSTTHFCVKDKAKFDSYCDTYQNTCGPQGECVNLPGWNYECICKMGYVPTIDRRSCIRDSPMTMRICKIYGDRLCKNGKCKGVGRSYECVCESGFRLTTDRKSCIPSVNFCNIFGDALCQNGQCISTERSYMCKCDPGYELGFDGKTCSKKDTGLIYSSSPFHQDRRSYERSRELQPTPAPYHNLYETKPVRAGNSYRVDNRAYEERHRYPGDIIRAEAKVNGTFSAREQKPTVEFMGFESRNDANTNTFRTQARFELKYQSDESQENPCGSCIDGCEAESGACQCPPAHVSISKGFCLASDRASLVSGIERTQKVLIISLKFANSNDLTYSKVKGAYDSIRPSDYDTKQVLEGTALEKCSISMTAREYSVRISCPLG